MLKIETLNEYQKLATRTSKFHVGSDTGIVYTALGLNGEAGEYAELIKKMIRDDEGILTRERREKCLKELGDVLWYLSQCALLTGYTLQEVAEHNIDKLASRANRGKIQGDGDDR